MSNLYGGADPRNIGIYTAWEAARYLSVPRSTLRFWAFGDWYSTKDGSKYLIKPVIKVPNQDERLLSFINLIELHVLNAIRRHHRVSLDKVRQAVGFIEAEFNTEHPLARQELYTDGLDLFIENFGQVISVSRHGQLAIREIIEAHLKRVDWDKSGIAARLYPLIRSTESEEPKLIVIDPRVSFGRPVVVGTSVPTTMFAQRYKAGESIDDLAMDYECDRLQVEEALRCELLLAA